MVPTQNMTLDGYHVFEKVKYSGKDYNEARQGWRAMLSNDLQFQAYAQSLAQLSGVDPSEFSETILKDYDQNILPGRTGFTQVGRDYEFIRDYKGEELFKAKMKAASEGADADGTADGSLVTSKLKIADNSRPSAKLAPENRFAQQGFWAKVGSAIEQANVQNKYGISAASAMREADAQRLRKPFTYSELMTLPEFNNLNRDRLKSIKDSNPNISDADLIKLYNEKEQKNQLNSELEYVSYNTSSGQQEAADKLLPGLKAGSHRVFRINNGTGAIEEFAATDLYTKLAIEGQASNGVAKSKQPALGFALGYTNHVASGSVLIPDPGTNDVFAVVPARTDLFNAQERLIKQLMQPIMTGSAKSSLPVQLSTGADGKPVYVASKLTYINGDEQITFHPARWNAQGKPEIDPEPITAEDGSLLGGRGMEIFLMKDLFKDLVPRESIAMFKAEKLMLNNS